MPLMFTNLQAITQRGQTVGLEVKVLIAIGKENNEYNKKSLKTPKGGQPETEE
jgi:hypothetical protein